MLGLVFVVDVDANPARHGPAMAARPRQAVDSLPRICSIDNQTDQN
jgi:hypothetical protein